MNAPNIKVLVDRQGHIYYPVFLWDQKYDKRSALRITDEIVFMALDKEKLQ